MVSRKLSLENALGVHTFSFLSYFTLPQEEARKAGTETCNLDGKANPFFD